MKVSLKWIKKYIDLPKDLTPEKIAYDLTVRTVEVESVENQKEKYEKDYQELKDAFCKKDKKLLNE